METFKHLERGLSTWGDEILGLRPARGSIQAALWSGLVFGDGGIYLEIASLPDLKHLCRFSRSASGSAMMG